VRSYSQGRAVMAQVTLKMCLRCSDIRSIQASISTLSKNYFEFHNNYRKSCVAILGNDG
jgi:hypothetical protein